MTFEEYQNQTKKTAVYPNVGSNFIYPTLGLSGEAGEVAEKIKKLLRDENSQITEERKNDIKKELGDVLWYVSQLSSELGLSLEEVVLANIEKLNQRATENKLHGDGDNR